MAIKTKRKCSPVQTIQVKLRQVSSAVISGYDNYTKFKMVDTGVWLFDKTEKIFIPYQAILSITIK